MRSSRDFPCQPRHRRPRAELEPRSTRVRRYYGIPPTTLDALASVSSIVRITRWPDSNARNEAIMSTIDFAGSAFEPSRAPWRTVPVAAPPPAPVTYELPIFRTFVRVKTPIWRGSTLPFAPARTGPPP